MRMELSDWRNNSRHMQRGRVFAAYGSDRLSQSYLPKSRSDFSATFTIIAFDNSSLRWLEINT
jgi:hypothetical protein